MPRPTKDLGIAGLARGAGCSESTVRRLDPLLKPDRDQWGRRLYAQEDITAARRFLAEERRRKGSETREVAAQP